MNFTVQAKVNFGFLNRTNRLKCVFRHYEETLQKVVHFLLKCTEQVRIFKNGFKNKSHALIVELEKIINR